MNTKKSTELPWFQRNCKNLGGEWFGFFVFRNPEQKATGGHYPRRRKPNRPNTTTVSSTTTDATVSPNLKESQISHPVLTAEMLQPSTHLHGLLWTCTVPCPFCAESSRAGQRTLDKVSKQMSRAAEPSPLTCWLCV